MIEFDVVVVGVLVARVLVVGQAEVVVGRQLNVELVVVAAQFPS